MSLRSLAFGMPVVLSPDGQWVAYTLRNPQRVHIVEGEHAPYFTSSGVSAYAVGSELWVTNVATGKSYDLTAPVGGSWGGSWSPDGRSLAFYSTRDGAPRIWAWDVVSKITRRVSDVIVRPFEGADLLRWRPDGRELVVKVPAQDLSPQGDTQAGAGATLHVYRAAPDTGNLTHGSRPAPSNWLIVDLALVNVATGKARQLVRSARIAAYFMSPAGNAVAFTVVKGGSQAGHHGNRNDIVAVDLDNRRTKTLAADVPQTENGLAVSWSPDGKFVAYTTNRINDADKEDCFVVPLAGGSPLNVTPGPHPPIADHGRGPLWDKDGKALYILGGNALWRAYTDGKAPAAVTFSSQQQLLSIVAPQSGDRVWSPDQGHSLYIRTRDRRSGNTGFLRVDLTNGRTTLVFEEAAAGHIESYSRFSVDAVGSTLVYSMQRSDSPEDLWITDPAFRSRRRLTALNPALDRYSFGRSRLIEWLSLDGDSLRGALLLPPCYVRGQRYPTVVWLYGGSRLSQNLNRFGLDPDVYNLQLLATRGFAILAPDAPIQAAMPMQDLAKSVLPGVNRAIELGVADPRRIGVAGHSYGGYSTLALLVQTSRFGAAVNIAGFGNLFTIYGGLSDRGLSRGVGWAERGQGRMGATPWERRDRYVENSPFFYLDRINTPLLLLHGTLDHAAPISASEELFTSLRRLQKEVVYVKYVGVGHALLQSDPVHQSDYYGRVIAWFESHLANSDMSSGTRGIDCATRGQSSLPD